MISILARRFVTRGQDLPQRSKAVAQAFDAVGDRMEAGMGCVGTKVDSLRQVDRMTMRLPSSVTPVVAM